MRRAPKCGAISPTNALICECGQDLRSGKAAQIKSQSKKDSAVWIFTGVGVALLGLFLSIIVYVGTNRGGTILFYGIILVGIGMVLNGIRRYRRLN